MKEVVGMHCGIGWVIGSMGTEVLWRYIDILTVRLYVR